MGLHRSYIPGQDASFDGSDACSEDAAAPEQHAMGWIETSLDGTLWRCKEWLGCYGVRRRKKCWCCFNCRRRKLWVLGVVGNRNVRTELGPLQEPHNHLRSKWTDSSPQRPLRSTGLHSTKPPSSHFPVNSSLNTFTMSDEDAGEERVTMPFKFVTGKSNVCSTSYSIR